MARTDSGYYSNLSNRPGYYGDPSSVLQEEVVDYQGDDSAMSWQYPYGMEGVEATYDQQQYSNYIVEGVGGQMAGYYAADSTPRTPMVATGYEASQDMNLDDTSEPYLKQEPQWSTDTETLPLSQQEPYYSHAQSSIMSPTTGESAGTPATSFDMDTSPSVPSPSTSRRRLPTAKPSTTTPTTPSEDARHRHGHMAAQSSTTGGGNRFPCIVGTCNKQFNRNADLDRHMKFIHCKATVPSRQCDYPRCGRHANPFHRDDHFRDHLRDQHKEDLLKRGESTAPDPGWWRERAPAAVFRGWWRCSKCFARVSVEREGWQCGSAEGSAGCGNFCEPERRNVRRLPMVCEYLECEMKAEGERERWLSPQKYREHLRNCHLVDVPIKEGKEGEKELADEGWWQSRDASVVCTPMWTCTRCLGAVDSRVDGFVCSWCGFMCEEARRRWHTAF